MTNINIPIRVRYPRFPKFSTIKDRIRRYSHIPLKQHVSALQTGNLSVVSIPPGASISIDGAPTGMNSSTTISDISIGDYTVTLSLPGYNDYTDITIISDGETSLFLAIMEPTTPPIGTGDLNVTSDPIGAEFGLYTGGSGTAPTTITGIPAGIGAYESGLIGYGVSFGSFIIEDGKTTDLHIKLFPETAEMGFVAIETIPMGAQIFIDGIDSGHTSFMTMIESGLHTYELRMHGYLTVKGEFTVSTMLNGFGVPTIVSVKLEKESAAGALILVGAAAVGLMMLPK